MELNKKAIMDMKHRVDACKAYLDALENGCRSPEKVNTLLDAAMHQIELCCIDLRRMCERMRPPHAVINHGYANYHHKEIYGEVTCMDKGWLDIRLHALLPHCKVLGGTQYVSDSITRLLDRFHELGGEIPYFEKAFLAIVEHCPGKYGGVFDHDNKGFKGVINALKGRLFPDDNRFELSLGLFTVLDEETCCHIYVTPYDDAGDFLYQLTAEVL